MAQMTIRNLDDEVYTGLKRRAAENGRSAEAEARAILRGALLPGTPRGTAESATLMARLQAFRAAQPQQGDESTAFIRDDRDRAPRGD